MAHALVTGGSGYFGSLLVSKLPVGTARVLDINEAEDLSPETEFMRGDIRDLAAVMEASRGVQVIYHNVAQVPLAKDVALFQSVNVAGTENVLKAALVNNVRKVIYTSSSAVFGAPRSNPVTEQTRPAPAEAYGRAKYKAELICADYVRRGLDVTIIRPRTIMGHGRLGIFQILFEWIRRGWNVPVLGRGDNIYQFIHAEDLARACIGAAGMSGAAVYNCGAKTFGTMREVLTALCEYAGTGSRVKSVPMGPAVAGMRLTSALGLSPLGPYHALMYGRSLYFDIRKATVELGWEPKWSNEAMFKQSYDWYCQNRESVLNRHGASHHRSPVKQGLLELVGRLL